MADAVSREELLAFQNSLFNLDSAEEEFYRILFYGKNGSGKTTAAATCPKPAMFLDCREKGTKSIKNIPGIKGKTINSTEDLDMALFYLRHVKHPFKSVIIDTGTALQDIILGSVMKGASELDPGKSMKMPTKNDWGSMSKVYKDYVAQFKELGEKMNVIWTCQEKMDDDADMSAGEYAVLPALSPSVSSALCASVDVIIQTLIINEVVTTANGMETRPVYAARVGPDQKVLTKIRTPKGTMKPQVVEDITFEKIQVISDGVWQQYLIDHAEEKSPGMQDTLEGLGDL